MMKHEFYYTSRDSVTKIHAIEWLPDRDIKGVLQICHGMVEYIDRYDEFAEFMSEHGYYVVGHDHLGHGKSIQTEADLGYFDERKGNQYVIGDIYQLQEMTRKKYPDVPYFMLGHSMGSFLLRQYLTMYAEGLAGVVIMGTGHQGMLTLCAGRMICRIIAAFKGWKYRSTFVDNLSFGGFNKKFEPGETSKEWITSDKKKRDEYVRDPLCSYTFTLGAYYQMFAGMKVLVRKGSMKRIQKTLPVLFTAGSDDPVGAFGKNVTRVYEKYRDAGIKDVSIHLYEGDRHEILNEVDRQNVYRDILTWIGERNKTKAES